MLSELLSQVALVAILGIAAGFLFWRFFGILKGDSSCTRGCGCGGGKHARKSSKSE